MIVGLISLQIYVYTQRLLRRSLLRRRVIRIVAASNGPSGVNRRSHQDSPLAIITHLLRTHSPNVRATGEARGIVRGTVGEPNIIVRAGEEAAGAWAVGVGEEVRVQDWVVWGFRPGRGIQQIGAQGRRCDERIVG